MDLNNKLIVITGANSGIGFEATKYLAGKGGYMVMVCRNEDKAEAARKEIRDAHPDAGIDIVLCDFSSMDDIRKAAEKINNSYDQIDILINNHGFIASEFNETVDGLEETFGVNHIGYFLFTNLLMDKVKAAGEARIISVASEAHRNGVFNPDDLQLRSNYSPWKAYANSKLFNIMFTVELADRLKDTDVTANCLHPGVINSNFGKSGGLLVRFFWKIAGAFMKDSREGAETIIYLAESDDVREVNGAYFKDKKAVAPRTAAQKKDDAEQLWKISEEICEL